MHSVNGEQPSRASVRRCGNFRTENIRRAAASMPWSSGHESSFEEMWKVIMERLISQTEEIVPLERQLMW